MHRRRVLQGALATGAWLAVAGCGDGSPATLPGATTAPPGARRVPPPAGMIRTSWSADPWALGSYSVLTVGAEPSLRAVLATPLLDRVFLAGEATDPDHPGTVHGAVASGERAAAAVLAVADPGERIVVVGAGVAGLRAARTLADEGLAVVVLEARDRLGGRLDTVQPAGWPVPVERGASWVHDTEASALADDLEALDVAAEPFDYEDAAAIGADGAVLDDLAGVLAPAADAVEEAVAWAEGTDEDLSLLDALTASGAADGVDPAALEHLLEIEVASEYGASARELSAWWGFAEGSEGDDLLVVGGYGRLADDLATGLDVQLGQAVARVEWGDAGVSLVAPDGGTVEADRVVLTVPLGVLRAGAVAFDPPLPDGHRDAVSRLGVGLLDKLLLRWDEPFWTEPALVWTRIAPAGTPFREWVNLAPLTGEPVLMGLQGGDTARAWADRSDDEVLAAATASLQVFLDAGW